MKSLKENFAGIFLSLAIAIVSFYLSTYFSFINEVILAFLIGVIINNIVSLPKSLKPGISFSGSKILEMAIIFMAFSINFKSIAALGLKTFLFVVIIVVSILLLTILLSKKLKSNNATSWLVGFGTAICGSSAIAAVAPTITKSKEDMAVSIAVVNLLGSVAMIILPFVLMLVSLTEIQKGFLIGASLQSVGNVAGAGAAVSESVKEYAVTVKLARVALLSPAVLLFSFLVNKNKADNENNAGFSLSIPYYLWLFIAITILTSFIPIPEEILGNIKLAGKFLLTISMAAIGLKVSFAQLFESGKSAIGFGIIIFFFQLALSVALLMFL